MMHLFLYFKICYRFCPFLFYTFYKSGIDESTEWSTIPVCPSLMCFFDRGNTKGTNSPKNLCLMFHVFFMLRGFLLGLILCFLDNLWFDDLLAA